MKGSEYRLDFSKRDSITVYSEYNGSKLICSYKNEEQLQGIIFQWFWNTYPQYRRQLFHVQQNMFGNAFRGAINKGIGVVAGISDLVLVAKGTVLFLELKVGANKQSPEQKDFETKVKNCGFPYIVVNSFEQFRSIVFKYFV